MSSSKDFLDKMKAAGEEHSADMEFVNIAKMIIKFGYSGFMAGYRPTKLFKPYSEPDAAVSVAEEVTADLQALGSKRDAVLAVLFNVPNDTNQSTLVDWDVEQITFVDAKDDSEWQIFFNALAEGGFPINKWFWGSYKNVHVGEYEKDGATKKRYLSLPVEHFADEAMAMASSGGGGMASVSSQWSERLRSNHVDPDTFLPDNTDDIHQVYNEIKSTGKKPYDGAPELPARDTVDENGQIKKPWQGEPNLPAKVFSPAGKLTPPAIKAYMSQDNMWGCETSDIDIVLSETPF